MRAAIQTAGAGKAGIDVRIIGFAQVMGDIADGASSVLLFAVITLLLTLLAVRLYCQSWRIALVPVVCSVIAVVWQLGALVLLRYGIDPIGLLVPFLIFAIGVSHGVQKISAVGDAAFAGLDSIHAARRTFRQLLAPAIVALLADLVGFITILMIPVPVIREMAVTACVGVAVVILTDLILLPVLVSYVHFDPGYHDRVDRRQHQLARVWHWLAGVTARGPATVVILGALLLGVLGWWKGRETPIGDTRAGVPELRADSRYNLDNDVITSSFNIGVDVLTAIVESREPVCVSHDLMIATDRFAWHMRNVPGVQDVITLPFIAKVAIAGWNEGSLKWRSIPREQAQLTQSTRYIETSTGLLNENCDIVPVMMFLADHRAETIQRVVAAVKQWRTDNPIDGARIRLATGNVGVMAATNETVESKEVWILAGVFAAVIVMCLVTFRSVVGTLLVVLPLALVSVLVYAVMALVGIGLKVSTLPMVALGAGIGVDYGIYLFSRMQQFLHQGRSVRDAYEHTLRVTGAEHHLHRPDPLGRRRDLGVLAAAVPGRHRHHAHVHVPGEHARGGHPPACARRLVHAPGRVECRIAAGAGRSDLAEAAEAARHQRCAQQDDHDRRQFQHQAQPHPPATLRSDPRHGPGPDGAAPGKKRGGRIDRDQAGRDEGAELHEEIGVVPVVVRALLEVHHPQ